MLDRLHDELHRCFATNDVAAAMINGLVHDVELIALKGDPSRAQVRDLGRGAPPTDVLRLP